MFRICYVYLDFIKNVGMKEIKKKNLNKNSIDEVIKKLLMKPWQTAHCLSASEFAPLELNLQF